ncbi:MAG: peptide chain release factor 2 [Acidimicrobiales bacterium]|nr:peptide chain release factor 2 [Acidimicrobiales bacterium]
MQDFSDELRALATRLDEAKGYLKIDELRARRPQLEAEMSRPDLWDDADAARKVQTELSALVDDIGQYEQLDEKLTYITELAELAREMGDESEEPEIAAGIAELATAFEHLELRSLFVGEYDEKDAVCLVKSGEGGTDAQDWADMLLRMYKRWCDSRGFDFQVESISEGTEAGISSAEFTVRGRYAYGLMRAEHGVHRLVRISPFNNEGKRQTAFASVQVVPFFEEMANEVEIDEKDLRIDTYRSSGAGGQHINVTDSAVRITHNPTGIVVSCQNERSQHQNKDRAMQMLAAKLLDLERQQRDADIAEIAGEAKNVGFGSQIRSYVTQPYQMVKDLRTEHEVGNVESVFNGDLDGFMEAYLRQQRAAATGEAANA